MYQVETDHKIDAYGDTGDLMKLLDCSSGAELVTASRPAVDGTWTITAAGTDDRTAGTRPDAINEMVDMALATGTQSGYSTLVPHGLSEMP